MQKVAKIYYQHPAIGQEYQPGGCGFIIGNYFLTAGHAVDSLYAVFWVEVNGKLHKLDKNKFFQLYKDNNNHNHSDVLELAIFELEGFNNPLSLATEIPQTGMKLVGYFVNESATVIDYELMTINKTQGLYFEGVTSKQLYQGSSGSPLYYNDHVIGMLVAGNMKDHEISDTRCDARYCRYLSSSAILDVMKCLG